MADRSNKEIAADIFQKYYKNLTDGLKNHLLPLAASLFSIRLVSADTRDMMLDNNSSCQLKKCMLLLKDVEDRLKRDHTVFEKFCDVLCSQDVDLPDLADPMRHDFQQLCQYSAKPTLHGLYSYSVTESDTSSFVEPNAESQADAADKESLANPQPSRAVQYDLGSDSENMSDSRFVHPFATPQQPRNYEFLESEQVVPIDESHSPSRSKTLSGSVYIDFDAKHYLKRNQETREKYLISDMVVSWDKHSQECKDCASIVQAKVENVRQYYEEQLQKESTAKSAAVQCVKDDEEKKRQHLLEAITMQAEDKTKQLKKKEDEIEQLQCKIDNLQKELHSKLKERDKLKSAICVKEKDLHDIKELAKLCPIYSSQRRRENLEQKKAWCTDIQSLVIRFFASQNPDEKGDLQKKIRDKLSRFTPLRRRRSFSQ